MTVVQVIQNTNGIIRLDLKNAFLFLVISHNEQLSRSVRTLIERLCASHMDFIIYVCIQTGRKGMGYAY